MLALAERPVVVLRLTPTLALLLLLMLVRVSVFWAASRLIWLSAFRVEPMSVRCKCSICRFRRWGFCMADYWEWGMRRIMECALRGLIVFMIICRYKLPASIVASA